MANAARQRSGAQPGRCTGDARPVTRPGCGSHASAGRLDGRYLAGVALLILLMLLLYFAGPQLTDAVLSGPLGTLRQPGP
jgi:hypothetical protein